MRLFTGHGTYGATCEGNTLVVLICYARDEDDFREVARKKVGPWLESLMDVFPGVHRDAVTRELVPSSVLDSFDRLNGKVNIEYHTVLHVNAS